MTKSRKTQRRAGSQHHRIQVALWIVGIIAPIVTGAWALFLYSSDKPAAQPSPIAFKPPPIVPPVLTINGYFVGGWDVSISNSNASMMSTVRVYLVSPEGAFPVSTTTRTLGPLQVTPVSLSAFDESAQGQSNLAVAMKKLMFMDFDTTKCTLEVTVVDVAGKQHTAGEDLKCGQIAYMKNPPPPPT
jgi:hypothetical protein